MKSKRFSALLIDVWGFVFVSRMAESAYLAGRSTVVDWQEGGLKKELLLTDDICRHQMHRGRIVGVYLPIAYSQIVCCVR